MSKPLSARERLNLFLNETGVDAKRSLGQNFLISDSLIQKILQAARDEDCAQIIEIGPGPGALTEGLNDLQNKLILIELDSFFAKYWRERNYQVIEADALKLNWNQFFGPSSTILVSNLPYQISASLVIERCLDKMGLQTMILMFQKEVAQRILAKKESKEYGLLSVMAQTFWNIHKLADAGPRDFLPPPKVASRVLHFSRKPNKLDEVKSREKFLVFVKAAFAHRRKLLRSNLLALGKDANWIAKKFESLNISENARAENLTPETFVDLFLSF